MKEGQHIVLVFEPGKAPRFDVVNGLESMQKLVEGPIEYVSCFHDEQLAFVCNEEGKLVNEPVINRNENGTARGLHDARGAMVDPFCGTFFVTRTNEEGETVSIVPDDVRRALRYLQEPWPAGHPWEEY